MQIYTLLLFVMILVTALPHHTYAYCIYNQMKDNTELTVHQEAGQAYFAKGDYRFEHKNMPSGSKECCPYTSRHCSQTRSKSDDCSFYLAFSRDGQNGSAFPKTKCPCGGYITATGTFDKFSYQVYDADHNRVGGQAL